jgi:hypothetical protein
MPATITKAKTTATTAAINCAPHVKLTIKFRSPRNVFGFLSFSFFFSYSLSLSLFLSLSLSFSLSFSLSLSLSRSPSLSLSLSHSLILSISLSFTDAKSKATYTKCFPPSKGNPCCPSRADVMYSINLVVGTDAREIWKSWDNKINLVSSAFAVECEYMYRSLSISTFFAKSISFYRANSYSKG